jgi:hypothetical protein
MLYGRKVCHKQQRKVILDSFIFKWFHHDTVNYATPAVDIMDINVKPLSFFALPSPRKATQDTAACTLRLHHTAGK